MFTQPNISETTAPKAMPVKTPEPAPGRNDETPSVMFWIEAILHLLWIGFLLINFIR